jgi:RNA polymerase sigma-70 factor (ECF subfamily)
MTSDRRPPDSAIRPAAGRSAVAPRGPGPGRSLVAIMADQQSFRTWYDAVAPRVYAYLVSRCSSAVIAEELTQQTFIAAVRQAATYDGRDDAVPWLIGIARHHLASHFRTLEREERRHQRMVLQELSVADEGREWARIRQRDAVARALRGLPAMQRAVLVLRFFDRLSVRDIATEIGRSESATESLLGRARVAFERAYEEAPDAN